MAQGSSPGINAPPDKLPSLLSNLLQSCILSPGAWEHSEHASASDPERKTTSTYCMTAEC